MSRIALVAVLVLVAACAARRPAPVSDRTPGADRPLVEAPKPVEPAPPVEKPIPTHTVKRGETLVGIALQYGLDYRELAAWNNITNPNVLSVGQVLVVAAPAGTKPLAAATPLGTTPLIGPGTPIEARPLANTPNAKVEPRGLKVPYSDRALAQLGAADPGSAAAPAEPPQPQVVEVPAPAEPAKPSGTDREDVDWMWPVKGKVLSPFSEASFFKRVSTRDLIALSSTFAAGLVCAAAGTAVSAPSASAAIQFRAVILSPSCV